MDDGLLPAIEERLLKLMGGGLGMDDCLDRFPFLPNAMKMAVESLAAKGLVDPHAFKLTPGGKAILGILKDRNSKNLAEAAIEPQNLRVSANKKRKRVKPHAGAEPPENRPLISLVEAHNISRRFHKRLNANLPMSGSPEWTPEWAEETRKLCSRDGYSVEEIAGTLDFIASDVAPFGFCFARNIRSLKGIRKKWRNGMSKFSTAYNAYMEKKTAEAEKVVFKGEWAPEAEELEEDLLFLPHPRYSNPAKNSAWGGCCNAIASLILKFVSERKWPASLFGALRGHILTMKKKGVIFGVSALVSILVDFFRGYKGTVGYIDDGDGGHFDDNYMDEIVQFEKEMEKWK